MPIREHNPASMTILVVDDHDPIRKAIKRILLSMKFGEVLECFDGKEAIETLKRRPVDMILCDLYMRNVDGFTVLEYVRSRDMGADVPFVVVTGEASKEDIVKAADMGANEYVLKPFQADDLVEKVNYVLGEYFAPSTLLSSLRTAEKYFMNQEYKLALDCFNEALSINATSMRATHGKARTLQAMGDIGSALELLEDTVKKNHSFHKNFGAIADIYLEQKNNMKAITAMKRELSINSKQCDRQIQLARLLLKEGDAMGAIDHFREALKEYPKNRRALMGMGNAFAKAENLEKALYYFKRVRRYHPTHTKALEAAIKVAVSAGEAKKAELFLKDEKHANPDRVDAFMCLARFYVHEDDEEKALAVLDDLLAKMPENEQALKMKGLIYLRYKKFAEAVEALTSAASVSPATDIFVALGEAHLGKEDASAAIDVLNKALRLDHRHPHALFLLGHCFKKSQQFAKACVMFRSAERCGAPADRCSSEYKLCRGQMLKRVHSRQEAS
jgi:CheY-like chemotaxis protein